MSYINTMQMIMKKFLRFVLAALSLFAAVSCAKEVAFNEEEQEKEIVVPDVKTVPYDFTVGVEQTKSYINEKQIFWEKGDSLAVIDNVDGTVHKFTLKSFKDNEARFSGEINEEATTLYVIYPYDENARVDGGGKITTTLPAVQILGDNNTAKGALVAVGTAAVGDPVTLKNAFGLIQVKAKHSDISQIIVSGTGLSGKATFNVADGSVETRPSGSSVTLKPGESGFTKDAVYYLAAVPGETTTGFSVEMTRPTDLDGFGPSAAYTFTNKSITIPQNGGFKFSTDNAVFSWAWHIYNKDQLFEWNAKSAMWSDTDKVYLEEDIDMNSEEWTPHDFRGEFYGEGSTGSTAHVLTNFTPKNGQYMGFFDIVYGTVQNLTLGSETDDSSVSHETTTITGWSYVGSVAARMGTTGKLINITNYVPVEIAAGDTQKWNIGGIVGYSASEQEIEGCINNANVTVHSTTASVENNTIGGILGKCDKATKISGCYNYGDIRSDNPKSPFVGGIIGATNGYAVIDNQTNGDFTISLTNCRNEGKITVTANSTETYKLSIGGIAGYMTGATLSACTNLGNIESSADGEARVGGIAGACEKFNMNTIENCTNGISSNTAKGIITISHTGKSTATIAGILGGGSLGANLTISGCKNYAPITTSHGYVKALGGIVAHINNADKEFTVSDCHNYGAVTNTSEGTVSENIAGGIVGVVWGNEETISKVENSTNNANITSSKPAAAASFIGGIVGRCEHITLEGVSNSANVSSVHPAGSQNHNAGGIAGYLTGKTTTVTRATNSGNVSASGIGIANVGGLFGNIADGSASGESGVASNTGIISGASTTLENNVGGISGSASGTTFKTLSNSGTVKGTSTSAAAAKESRVGGIVGYTSTKACSFTDCSNLYVSGKKVYIDGNGKGKQAAGGIVGVSYGGDTLSGCTNSGEISGEGSGAAVSRIGGLIGYANNSTVKDASWNKGPVHTKAMTNDSCVGGIVAYSNGGTKVTGSADAKITNEGKVYSTGTVKKYVGGIVGCAGAGTAEAGVSYALNTGYVYCKTAGHVGVGGIVGGVLLGTTTTYSVTDCNNEGTVEHTFGTDGKYLNWVGGIVGRHQGGTKFVLENCVNGVEGNTEKGRVVLTVQALYTSGKTGEEWKGRASAEIGGIVGSSSKNSTIKNNTNYAPITLSNNKSDAWGYAGGILGGDVDPDAAPNGSVSLAGNYNYGSVSATVNNAKRAGAGGIIGEAYYASSAKFTGNYSYGNVSLTGTATDGGAGAVIGDSEGAATGITATVKKSITVGGVTYDAAKAAGTLATWLCPNNNNITATYVD